MEKYYTPNIKEFHVGFKYESTNKSVSPNYKYDDIKWNNNIHKGYRSINFISSLVYKSRIRIKYLDVDDIKNLGWELRGRDSWIKTFEDLQQGATFNLIKDKDNDEYQLYYNHRDLIIIYNSITSNQLFHGTIKNINELEVIMKQIGIL